MNRSRTPRFNRENSQFEYPPDPNDPFASSLWVSFQDNPIGKQVQRVSDRKIDNTTFQKIKDKALGLATPSIFGRVRHLPRLRKWTPDNGDELLMKAAKVFSSKSVTSNSEAFVARILAEEKVEAAEKNIQGLRQAEVRDIVRFIDYKDQADLWVVIKTMSSGASVFNLSSGELTNLSYDHEVEISQLAEVELQSSNRGNFE